MSVKARAFSMVFVLVAIGLGTVAWLELRAESGERTKLVLHGNVDIRELSLAFRVGGRMNELRVDEGDRVSAGQVVALLDPVPLQEELAAREAELARARAVLSKLEAGPRPQEIARARAEVREAQATRSLAERDLARQQGLLDRDATSEEKVDTTLTRFEEAAARLASAGETLALLEAGSRVEDIEAARAAVATAQAQRDLAQTQLADASLAAPCPAVVLARVLEPGSMVQAGSPVLSLSLRDPIYVRAYVSEPDLGLVPPGTRVWITTDSSAKRFEGQVGFVSPRAEFTPKSVETKDLRTDLVYRLRIVVEGSEESLLQGMPVTVDVPLGGQGS